MSYSSKRTDRLQKRRLYQEEGVPEYWIVDVDARHVERWTPRAAAAEVFTERLAWHPDPAAPALEVDLVAVAARLGISPDVVVVTGITDVHSAAVGSGCVRDYEAHIGLGTTTWVSAPVPRKKTDLFRQLAAALDEPGEEPIAGS